MDETPVTPTAFDAIDDLRDWRYVLGTIRAHFRAGSFTAAATLAAEIARLADDADHHPDIDIRYRDLVQVVLTTHAIGDITTLDVDLARLVSAAAREAGATSEPAVSQAIEIAIDTMDADRIRPFWAAVLGYRDVAGTLVDPVHDGPAVWFQQMDAPRSERNRIHIDVSVPHDVAEQRIAAALAAGGSLVSDERANAFWVLADADGNECCICTWQDR